MMGACLLGDIHVLRNLVERANHLITLGTQFMAAVITGIIENMR